MLEEGLAGSILEALAQPAGLTQRILDARRYARTLRAVEASTLDQIDASDPMVQTVWELQAETSQEIRAAREAKLHGG